MVPPTIINVDSNWINAPNEVVRINNHPYSRVFVLVLLMMVKTG